MKKKNIPVIKKSETLKDKRGELNKFIDANILKSLKFKTVEMQISKSNQNVFRGIYMQTGKFKEAKIIKLLKGKLIWFGINLKKNNKNFGKLFSYNLKSNQILYLPRGFAHASYSVKKSEVLILADNKYNNKSSIGINFKDKRFFLKISKYFKNKKPVISNWHKNYGNFEDIINKLK